MDTAHPTTTGRKASTIDQFCLDHSISRATFYRLTKAGQAPRMMEVRGRRLISEEAAAAWRAERTEAA
jgi:predicted DNA-binding transcriptional regulator AlpA